MPARTHFGCRVIKQDARLTRENYAQITPSTRKQSRFHGSPQMTLQQYGIYINIKSNEDVEKAIDLYLQSPHYGAQREQCLKEIANYLYGIQRIKASPDSDFAKTILDKYILSQKSSSVYCDSEKWDELIIKYDLLSYNDVLQDVARQLVPPSNFIRAVNNILKLNIESPMPKQIYKSAKGFYSEWQAHLEQYDKCTIQDVITSKFQMPPVLYKWQVESGTESYTIPPDYYIQEYILWCFFPYFTDTQSKVYQAQALQNFDINMSFCNSLSKDEFNQEIENFLRTHSKFKEITNLNEYDGVSGIYVMILDEYKRLYIGITKNLKQRMFEHWRTVKPLDRLLFGGIEDSILSIDSFRHFDTTRILFWAKNVSNEELGVTEYELIENCFSPKFLQNRITGGSILLNFGIKTLPYAQPDNKE